MVRWFDLRFCMICKQMGRERWRGGWSMSYDRLDRNQTRTGCAVNAGWKDEFWICIPWHQLEFHRCESTSMGTSDRCVAWTRRQYCWDFVKWVRSFEIGMMYTHSLFLLPGIVPVAGHPLPIKVRLRIWAIIIWWDWRARVRFTIL